MLKIYTIPKLEEAINKANETQECQDVRFLHNELKTHDQIYFVFGWLFDKEVDFETKRTKDRFIISIKPQ